MALFQRLPSDIATHCVHKVHVTPVDTFEKKRRVAKSARRGLPADVCGEKAKFLVDGLPHCRAHAAHEALQQLLEGVHA